MKSKIKNLYHYAIGHKKFSAVLLVFIALGVYSIFKDDATATTTQYIFAKVQKQNVSVSVTGSGQVSALDQVDILSEVSGTIDYVGVKAGDNVAKGKVIAHIDSADAERAVQNADLNLTNAEIAYNKAKKLYDNQLGQSPTTVSDLAKALDDGYNAVANAFIDLPKIFMDVDDIYYDPTNSPYFSDMNVLSVGGDLGIKYKYDSGVILDTAKTDYERVFEDYKKTSSGASQKEITDLIAETYSVVKRLSLALTGAHNTIDFLSDRMASTIPSAVETDKSLLSSYITKTTNHMTKLSDALTDIEDAGDSAVTAEINLKSAELSLNQAQDSLKSAKENLFDHTIIAPFAGVIAKVPIATGDKVSTVTSAATIITKNMKVTISLNEVDATKISVGNKATLTFDAIEDLVIEGIVYEIDVVGTVSNGVVSYDANISFDAANNPIKAGMTTNVAISTQSITDVLAISSTAISTKDGKNFVLVPIDSTNAKSTTDKTALKEVEIKTGLSGDELTEITTGLAEGDTYVSGTKTSAASKNTSGSLFSMFGGRNTQTSSRTTSSSSASKTSSTRTSSQNTIEGGAPMPPQ